MLVSSSMVSRSPDSGNSDRLSGSCCESNGCPTTREVTEAIQKQAAVMDFAPTFNMGHPIAFQAAAKVAAALRKRWNVDFDDAGAIGRRYRRQDEIGTPYCVTVDFESLEDNAATVRERDAMTQERIGLDAVEGYLAERLGGC